jgi:hypothetical protein
MHQLVEPGGAGLVQKGADDPLEPGGRLVQALPPGRRGQCGNILQHAPDPQRTEAAGLGDIRQQPLEQIRGRLQIAGTHKGAQGAGRLLQVG